MVQLTLSFLKIFFRNSRAMFFVLLLPAGIFIIAAYLGVEQIIRFDGDHYTDFLLAGVVAFALMQSGIYTVAYNLVDYRRGHILKRMFQTPLTPQNFMIAQALSRFVIALIQTAVLLVLGLLFFETQLSLDLLWLPFIILIGGTVFLSLGFLISMVAKDYEEAAPYTSVIGLTLGFMGDAFFPVRNLPQGLQRLADYLPLKPLSALLRHSLFEQQPQNLGQDVAVLILWLLVSGAVSVYFFSRRAVR